MVYLLKYEWHKFIRTKKNWLVFLLILCSFIGVVLRAKCKNVANKMQKIGFKKRHFKRLLNAK